MESARSAMSYSFLDLAYDVLKQAAKAVDSDVPAISPRAMKKHLEL
jgi:hypothetical protein